MNGEMACSKVKESAMFPLFKHEIETRKFDSNKLQNSFQVQDHLIGMYFTLLDICAVISLHDDQDRHYNSLLRSKCLRLVLFQISFFTFKF